MNVLPWVSGKIIMDKKHIKIEKQPCTQNIPCNPIKRTQDGKNFTTINITKNLWKKNVIFSIDRTRGHARFARSPLVIRLGDSRIRRGNSGYGEVLKL